MGVLERVQRAIEGPTAQAQKLLAETPDAEAQERLSVLVNSWFRGIAAALEELAIELDAIRDGLPAAVVEHERSLPVPRQAEDEAKESHEPPSRRESSGGLDEAALAERARASRDETRALREEPDE
jgi:hypothetical protein